MFIETEYSCHRTRCSWALAHLCCRIKATREGGSRPSEGLEIAVFFTVLNGFVGKQVCSGKPRNKKGEDSKSDCSLAQLEAGERRPQKQPLMYLVSNLQF